MTDVCISAKTGKVTVVSGEGAAYAAVTPEMVKAEARRRILNIAPEWQQLNAIREGEFAMFVKIDAIRSASDALEAMMPIPPDYQSDTYWISE